MNETIISIPIDTDTAAKYNAATDEERRKIQLLLRVLLRNSPPSNKTLQQLMDEMSDEAQARGLTPEILDRILNDDE